MHSLHPPLSPSYQITDVQAPFSDPETHEPTPPITRLL